MMENGELMASEVLPKVAVELSNAARNNDALNQSLQTSRSQWRLLANNFKMLFDGLGSAQLDRGLATILRAFNKMLVIVKPLAQGLFAILGVIMQLIGNLSTGVLKAFDPAILLFKEMASALERLSESTEGVDLSLGDLVVSVGQVASLFIPWLRMIQLVGMALEEVINLVVGLDNVETLFAGEGDTIGERFANSMFAGWLGGFNQWWDEQVIPNFEDKMYDLVEIMRRVFNDQFPALSAVMGLDEPLTRPENQTEVSEVSRRQMLSDWWDGMKMLSTGAMPGNLRSTDFFSGFGEHLTNKSANSLRTPQHNLLSGNERVNPSINLTVQLDGETRFQQLIDGNFNQLLQGAY